MIEVQIDASEVIAALERLGKATGNPQPVTRRYSRSLGRWSMKLVFQGFLLMLAAIGLAAASVDLAVMVLFAALGVIVTGLVRAFLA
ncbi:hypothetical protein [Ectothiorhodospira shaposhnikovii]|uniref:hypothetical protein n=1 Tax=Ectothiorhodospira shaposhnikovii TaxID=1054 RepID=UPI001905ABA8|nr:hypothetical protein [Ectothiorhodospira shaposhnikovii]